MRKILKAVFLTFFTALLINADAFAQADSVSIPNQNAFYMGGNEFLITYLLDHVSYPGAAITHGTSGTVKLSYWIETDSSISNVNIVQDPGNGCGNAFSSLLSTLKYVPAIQGGAPSRQQVTLEFPMKAAIRND